METRNNPSDYRPLTTHEVLTLEKQGCRADNWENIRVKDGFAPGRVEDVRFHGQIRLGAFRRAYKLGEGVFRPSGIRRAELYHVTVGDDCLIEHIHGHIANYDIADGVIITGVGTMVTDGPTSFGIGTRVNVLSEAGDYFQASLHPDLTAQTFCLLTMLKPEERKRLNEMAEAETKRYRSPRGHVGRGTTITGTRRIRNVSTGACAAIDCADCVEECFLCSTEEAPVRVGTGVICRRSLLQSGAEVTDGAKVSDCLVGQSVHLGKGFSAEASLFFANSYMDNGEACAVCAGPYTVSHHKSTLLIGGMFSFFNAGSGTNMSNHAYKLGPLHYGTMDRGCKTASGTHLVWDGHIGAFSLVMGKYDSHADLSSFPFSYLFCANGQATLLPGINFATVGTYRDIRKWPSRDRRPSTRLDCISTYDALNAYVICRIREGRAQLERLQQQGKPDDDGAYTLQKGVRIPDKALQRGIDLYRRMEQLYVARHWQAPADETATLPAGEAWHDMLGTLLPDSVLDNLLDIVRRGTLLSLEHLRLLFARHCADYPLWVARHVQATYTTDEIEAALRNYEANLRQYYDDIEADARKEADAGGQPMLPHFREFIAALHEEKAEQLKKAKEKASSLPCRED